MKNIIEINEMIDLIDFYLGGETSNTPLIVGGMVGTNIVDDALDTILNYIELEQILFIQGCQDYIDLLSAKNKMYNQYMYYGDMFNEVPIDSIIPTNVFQPKILNPPNEYERVPNYSMMEHYSLIIINDAHLIPADYLKHITKNFAGKIIMIVDPFDIGSENYIAVPTVVDTFLKLSPVKVYARSVYDVDTRMINKKAKGVVNEVKMSIRSIGKIDDKQYISNDPDVLNTVRLKQLKNSFRKNNKVIVTGDRIYTAIDGYDRLTHRVSVIKNSMIVVSSTQTKLLLKLRLYGSKQTFYGDLSYIDNTCSRLVDPYNNKILCKPANILSINESRYHRYQHAVLATTGQNFNQRERYSILKNALSVTIAHI